MGGRPSGTVTFLFTDVEGSTRLWAADAEAMSSSLLVHDSIVSDAIEAHDGYVFTTAGDSFAAAFSRASDAGDQTRAAELIVEMGTGRSPITVKYGEELAGRLGVADAYATQLLAAVTGTGDYLGLDRAKALVRDEAARRGWIDASSG